jgi:hypothetical protein
MTQFGYAYASNLNLGEGNFGDATFGNITADNIIDLGLTPSKWVGTNTNQQLESRTLSGSANRINITNLGTVYTVSTPQDIALTSDVTFNSATLNSLTANRLVSSDATDKLISTDLLGTNNQITVTGLGTGTITLATPQDIATTSTPTFTSAIFTGQYIYGGSLANMLYLPTANNDILVPRDTLTFLKNKRFEDSSCAFASRLDTTKLGYINTSLCTTGTISTLSFNSTVNRTIQLPDASCNLLGDSDTTARTIAGQFTFSNSINITPTTNQIRLGTTNTVTINSASPASSRTYTIPDTLANSSFVMTDLAQTINGVKTFSSAPRVNLATNQLVLGTTNTVTINSAAPATSRIYSIPDTLANSSFVMTDLAQTINGVKTFSSAPIMRRPQITLPSLTANIAFSPFNVLGISSMAAGTYATEFLRMSTTAADTWSGVMRDGSQNVNLSQITLGSTATTTGITLNNSTASYVPAVLNHYEEYSDAALAFTNVTGTTTLKIVRVGRMVQMQIYAFNFTVTPAAVSIQNSVALPARFRPISRTNSMCSTIPSTRALGIGQIEVNPTGFFTIAAGANYTDLWGVSPAVNQFLGLNVAWCLN